MFSFWKREEEGLTVAEFNQLSDRLDAVILSWARHEVATGIQSNTKLAEILIFNFKLVYSPDARGTEMRDFISKTTDLKGETDFTFSRIQDLFIIISTMFPNSFIEDIRLMHYETIRDLGYPTDDSVFEQLSFAWLVHRIQHTLRYCMSS